MLSGYDESDFKERVESRMRLLKRSCLLMLKTLIRRRKEVFCPHLNYHVIQLEFFTTPPCGYATFWLKYPPRFHSMCNFEVLVYYAWRIRNHFENVYRGSKIWAAFLRKERCSRQNADRCTAVHSIVGYVADEVRKCLWLNLLVVSGCVFVCVA